MTDASPTPATAGLVRRLLALTYDSLLLLGVAFAYGVVVWALRKAAGDDLMEPLSGVSGALGLLFLWLALASYYVLCWTTRGQTLGMKSWRLRVESLDGGHPRAWQAWLRCLLAPVSAAALGVGYLWCWFDRRHGCWHDRWTETRVVVLAKERKKPGGQ
jgi:uncharacterized RDD family membrane protein YckC